MPPLLSVEKLEAGYGPIDVLHLARTRIDAPEIHRYARSLESYTRDLG